MFYLKKIFKVLADERWQIFLIGWILVVIFKRRFYKQKFGDVEFYFPEPLVFLWQFKEIYIDECYDFVATSKVPVLIDCGANVGMCSVYWAKKYPSAIIYAIEPSNDIAWYLEKNLKENKVNNLKVIKSAAWISDGVISFSTETVDGGAISADNSKAKTIEVPSFNMGNWLKQFSVIDYLKMDIEGAEVEVMKSLDNEQVKKVKNIFIEYHQNEKGISGLGEIISKLESSQISPFVTSVLVSPKSLAILSKATKGHFLTQINIHGSNQSLS